MLEIFFVEFGSDLFVPDKLRQFLLFNQSNGANHKKCDKSAKTNCA